MSTINSSELSVRAILLGIILAIVLCAANTYLGLYAGMTVAASIPAAVISMGLFRGMYKKSAILENNIVQTAASSGEALAAGIIFTMPALVISGVWEDYNFFVISAVAILGGVLGIIFMIPMREALIVRAKDLTYPEGVACAEVLKAGDESSSGLKTVMFGIMVGALAKFFTNFISVIKGSVEWAFRIKETVFYLGSDISAALVGVGFIIGFHISFLVFIGGAIAWLVAIPIFSIIQPDPSKVPLDYAWNIWDSEIRYLGVGAMLVAGIHSIISVRSALIDGLKEVFSPKTKIIASRNLSSFTIILILVLTITGIIFLYYYLTNSIIISLLSAFIMVIMSFFLVAVATYICGLVGSSNSPVSGMTITALLFTILIMFLCKLDGRIAILSTLGIAGVVCCATCTSGDIAQDLKTGILVGATPRNQQIIQIISTVVSAFVIGPILLILNNAYGIGTGAPGSLKAPQATLFASITQSFFESGGLDYQILIIGIVMGLVILIINKYTSRIGFPLYLMPIAVGIYLPFSLSIPMLLGGIVIHQLQKKQNGDQRSGILFSSGLIAGEALLGIFIALFITIASYLGYTKKLPIQLDMPEFVSVLALLLLVVLLYIKSRKTRA